MKSQTILITGSSSGFGLHIVGALLEQGHRVIATMRRAQERQDIFAGQMQEYPGLLTIASLDVTSAQDRDDIAALIQNQFAGRLDVLINNAGYGVFGALEDTTEEQITRQMDVNFSGLVLLTRKLLPFVREAKGRIINFSSLLGYMGMPLSSLYVASKFAVEGFSESLYYELKPHGVRVSMIEPGGFRTDFGANLEWAALASSSQSAYLVQTTNYKILRQGLTDRPPTPLTPVIRAVLMLIKAKNPPLRVRCGKDAHSVYWMSRLLPAGVLNWLLSKGYAFAFDNERRAKIGLKRLNHAQ